MHIPLAALGLSVLLFCGCRAPHASRTAGASDPLASLSAGNARFHGQVNASTRADNARRLATINHQQPFAVIVGCADSRTAPELIFDQSLGDLFVIRTAGNLVDTHALASIEYAVAKLGTRLVVVLGHEHCGAVHAAVASYPAHGNLAALLRDLQPAVTATQGQPGDAEANATAANARLMVRRIAEKADFGALAPQVRLVAGTYSLSTGKVTWLD